MYILLLMSKTTFPIKINGLLEEVSLLFEKGEYNKVIVSSDEILSVYPDFSLVHYLKGMALLNLHCYEDACFSLHSAVELVSDNPDYLYNFALSLQKLCLYEKALSVYHELLLIQPRDLDALYNIGCCYFELRDYHNSIIFLKKVLAVDHTHISALNNLGYINHLIGQYDVAENIFSKLIELDPDHESAEYMVMCIRGEVCSEAPLDYVEKVFDNYSERFDDDISSNLYYSVPQKLRLLFDTHFTSEKVDCCLDLGCGTGLSGEAFHDICNSMAGVDISSKMLEIAKSKNIYTHLEKNGITKYLEGCESGLFDLIIAADVFTYFGNLKETFTQLYSVASANGYFVFSVELGGTHSFKTQKTGRFVHSIQYVESLSKLMGWNSVATVKTELRKEKNEWVDGVLFLMKK